MSMLQTVLERVEGDLELLSELVEMFPECFQESYGEMAAALERRDAEAGRSAAHTIKGMCANLALERSASLARDLEAAFQEGDWAACASLMETLRQEAEQEHQLLARLVQQECDGARSDR